MSSINLLPTAGELKNKIISWFTINPSRFIEQSTKTMKPVEPQTLSKTIKSHLNSEALYAAQMPLSLSTKNRINLVKTLFAEGHYKKIRK